MELSLFNPALFSIIKLPLTLLVPDLEGKLILTDSATQAQIVSAAINCIDQIIEQVRCGNFPLQSFSLLKDCSGELPAMPGIYIIIRRCSPSSIPQFYIGGGSCLVQRKGEHNYAFSSFTPQATHPKIASAFREDLLESGDYSSTFYFIPILIFNRNILPESLTNAEIQVQLEKGIENALIEHYRAQKGVQLYNTVEGSSKFQPNNTLGGSPNSGSADKAVLLLPKEHAWQTVSAAAACLGCSTKSIRNYITEGHLAYISYEQYLSLDCKKTDRELHKGCSSEQLAKMYEHERALLENAKNAKKANK
uniref:Putative GIY-YIG homing endonuclease n=1 Tax=Hafniomonas laevis TaxID=436124 RepID=A0A0S2LNV8_9CHLO|nr:putative GIY-YIG homing endonuclease [Hafniomonas laevis]ALO63085.1 putative GIY-YIG homing endonuclease [Hafniomonas laevis]